MRTRIITLIQKIAFLAVLIPTIDACAADASAEKVFNVKVKSVKTLNIPGKKKRVGVHFGKTPDYKKAVVTLTEDSKSIEFFESMA